jgi:hypothetical protein
LKTAPGGYEVFNLSTGEVIQQMNVTCILTTDAAVKAVEALAKRDSMEAFKIKEKRGIILYDSSLAGVGLDGQDDKEDPPEEDKKMKTMKQKKMKQKLKKKMQSIGRGSHPSPRKQVEESNEEFLQGEEQLKVRQSTRTKARITVLNVAKNSTKRYDTQLSQADYPRSKDDCDGYIAYQREDQDKASRDREPACHHVQFE